jgi:NAD(P)-dependent dehydrogenase (short-subunit alcohol dehydrogenase family)
MKMILIGASGTIGKKIAEVIEKDHELVRVGSKSGDFRVDIGSGVSIEKLFKDVGPFDGLINVAGDGHFGPLTTMKEADFRKGLDSKLMGQINLVLIGQHYVRPQGSFTLTAGVLSEDPVRLGANLSAVNSALEAFGRAAAIELEKGIRINVVSPGVVKDSPHYFPYFPGHIPVEMDRVVAAYIKSAFGAQTGQVYKVV